MANSKAEADFDRVPVVNVHKENIGKFQPIISNDIQVGSILK